MVSKGPLEYYIGRLLDFFLPTHSVQWLRNIWMVPSLIQS